MQQIIRCPNCGSPNTPGQRFCGTCGANLPAGCPNCGAENDPDARFCGNCGAQLLGDFQQGDWGQQQSPVQQGGWGAPPGMQQQAGWNQPPQPPQPPQSPSMQQQGGWGQPPQPPGMQQQAGWGQPPGMQRQATWAPAAPRSASSSQGTFLVILLVVLLIGLGGFGYWAFYGSPPWQGSSSSSALSITGGPLFAPASAEGSDTVNMTITWETSDLAIGSVEYGTSTSYGSVSNWESNYVKSHSVEIVGLDKDSSYHCRVISKDKKGNQVTSNDVGFKTPQ
jgi:hypothetical protein